jgi:hypothetical protein
LRKYLCGKPNIWCRCFISVYKNNFPSDFLFFIFFFRNNRSRKKLYMFLSWMTSSNMIRIINIWRMRCIHENEILIKFIQTYWYMASSPSAQEIHNSLYPTDCAKFCVLQTQILDCTNITSSTWIYLCVFIVIFRQFYHLLSIWKKFWSYPSREKTFPIKYKYCTINLELGTQCYLSN